MIFARTRTRGRTHCPALGESYDRRYLIFNVSARAHAVIISRIIYSYHLSRALSIYSDRRGTLKALSHNIFSHK